MVVQHISQRHSSPNPSVFISYSHKDKQYLDRLRVHLRPQEREGAITFWDDTQIKPGDHWKREIERALESAQVAILLVSADFLASDFVTEEEVRKLLAAERRGVRILPVILTPCGFPSSHLSSFQAINEPSKPLSGMNSHDQDVVWQRVVENVIEKLNPHPPVLYSTYPVLTAPSSSGGQEVKGKTIIFKEHRDAIDAAIDMLEGLPPLHHERVTPIKISVQGTTIFKSLGPEMYQRWSRARVEALKNGWSMRAYWRLNDDGFRMERWVKDTLDVLQAGVYEPYYFLDRPNQKGLLSTPYDLLLIPKSHNRPAQAMLFFATTNEQCVDAAILTEDENFYALMEAHLQQLVVSTRPLFDVCPPGDRHHFLDEMERRESQGGERLLVKPDLAVLTIPLEFYQGETPWTQRARRDGLEVDKLYRLQERRRQGLEKGTVHFRDICSKRAIREWVRTQTYSAYQSVGSEMKVDPKWIRAHLLNAIKLLAHDNYEIALLDDEEQNEASPTPQRGHGFPTTPLWMVAGRRRGEALFVEVLKHDEGQMTNSLNLRIDEERIVRAFISYFDRFWQELALPKDRNKANVKKWLESLLSELPADS